MQLASVSPAQHIQRLIAARVLACRSFSEPCKASEQGWGTYLLSRAASIVEYIAGRQQITMNLMLKFYLYLTMRDGGFTL